MLPSALCRAVVVRRCRSGRLYPGGHAHLRLFRGLRGAASAAVATAGRRQGAATILHTSFTDSPLPIAAKVR